MLIRKEEARRQENSPTCIVYEHDHPTKNLSYAMAVINGRYPDNGKKVKNLECEEIMFTISGSGMIHSDQGDFQLNPKDSYHLPKGEAYWIEGKDLVLGITNSPKWTFEQYREVD